jgi:metallo-beta-lactamase class B
MNLLAVFAWLMFQTSSAQAAEWNADQKPFRIHGETYYVGVRGLSAVLIASGSGHALIDGGLPESAAKIASNIRQLGFRVEDVRVILNSHAHNDHAGGIAELQRLSGARVVARAPAAAVLRTGRSGPDDPQFGLTAAFPPVATVDLVEDGATVRAGATTLTAHATGGHTPGSTTWTWQSCVGNQCVQIVYADSLTAVSADGFRFTASKTYPHALADFEKSFATIAALPCGILVTPHPDATRVFQRLAEGTLMAGGECRRYVDRARAALARRVATEKSDR